MRITQLLREKQADLFGKKTVTIAFLGDSVTQGCFELYQLNDTDIQTVFRSEKAYPSYFKKIIASLYPSVPVNIINAGISGSSTPDGADRVKRDVLSYSPDLVVVSFGLNDSIQGKQGLPNYIHFIKEILKQLKSYGCEIIFLTENMMNTNITHTVKMNQSIEEIARQTMQIQNSGILKDYFIEAEKICKDYQVPVCNVYHEWELLNLSGVNTTDLLANGINHPNEAMHRMTAFLLLQTILHN